jgi:hypothetical protein
LIEMEVRRVLTLEPPMLGAYSRFGWRHPGPIMFFLLALPYRTLGSDARALSTAALLLNVGVMVWAATVVRRRGDAALAIFSACVLLMSSGMGGDGIGYAWNVSVTLVPLCALIIGCWAALLGDRLALPLAVTSFAFVFQTHVGAGVVAAPLAVGTALCVILRPELRQRHRPTRRGAVLWGLAILTLVPIAIDTVVRAPGNLARLVRWSVSNDEASIGVGEALRLLGRASSVSFPFEPEQPRFVLWADTGRLGLLPGATVLALIVLGVVASRRRDREMLTLTLVLATVWVSGLIAASSIVDPPEWWLVEWLQPLGWMTIAGIALGTWRFLVRPHLDRYERPLAVAGIAALVVVVSISTVVEVGNASELDGRNEVAVEPVDLLSDAIERYSGADVVRIDVGPSDFSAENMLAGLVDESIARGVAVCVDATLGYKFPDAVVCDPRVPPALVLRTETTASAVPDGEVRLATYDPLDSDRRRRADEARAEIAAALTADGRPDLVDVLDTPLAAEAVLDDPGPRVDALRSQVLWLDAVREQPGLRFGLDVVATDQPTRRP